MFKREVVSLLPFHTFIPHALCIGSSLSKQRVNIQLLRGAMDPGLSLITLRDLSLISHPKTPYAFVCIRSCRTRVIYHIRNVSIYHRLNFRTMPTVNHLQRDTVAHTIFNNAIASSPSPIANVSKFGFGVINVLTGVVGRVV